MANGKTINKPFVSYLHLALTGKDENIFINRPTWKQIEEAFSKLNKAPFGGYINLSDEEDGTKALLIFGQSGVYHISILVGEIEYYYYLNGSTSSEVADVAIAGNFFKEHQICRNSNLLKRIVKYFYETGERLQDVLWEYEKLPE
jgi:hypothetical protein